MSHTVVGLDLSARGLAGVVIPSGWDRKTWRRLPRLFASYPLQETASPEERCKRLEAHADSVLRFCQKHHATDVFIEEYAFSRKSSSVTKLAEIGGVVKLVIWEKMQLAPKTVIASAARKLFLGHNPAGAKEKVEVTLRLMGASFETGDEADAFVVANWGLADLGLTALALPPPE